VADSTVISPSMAKDSFVVAFAQSMILFARGVNIQMAFQNAVMRDRLLRAHPRRIPFGHFFNAVSQFTTTVTGDEGSPARVFTIRNFLPSPVTSYRCWVLVALTMVGDRNNA
jgi:hypothetical protein